jgi:hypothetical protein
MRVTIDIPDAIHAELKRRAAAEGTTMRALILRAIDEILRESREKRRLGRGTDRRS